MVFSGEFDRVYAALAIANGVLARGEMATLFFSFWAVAALRNGKAAARKAWLERLVGKCFPSSIDRLPVSRFNCGGLGAVFFRWWMGRQQAASLRTLLAEVQDLGVRIVVCELSLQMLGLRREERIEGVSFGGVAGFVQQAATSGFVLFI